MSVPVHPKAAESWRLLVEAIAAETDPGRRANLELVARHVVAEVAGAMDELMGTLTDDPVYHYLGATSSPGPVGREAVRAYYEDSVATGKNRLEFELSRVAVSSDAVFTEGVFRHAYRGEHLRAGGADEGTVSDPDGWYLVEYRALVVWPVASDGLLSGEDVYVGEPVRVLRKLADTEGPQFGPADRYKGEPWQEESEQHPQDVAR